jgi:hypothetical protein
MSRGRSRNPNPVEPGVDPADASFERVTDVTLPDGVPRNPDGTPALEGTVSEAQAQKIGALNIESAAKNKRSAHIMERKALGERDVKWNTDDPLELFYEVRGSYPGDWNSMIITVTRDQPAPVLQYQPVFAAALADSIALYDHIKSCHGQSPQSRYKVCFRTSQNAERATGRIMLPDTTAPSPVRVIDSASPRQPPPQPGYAPPGWGAPPGAQGYPYPPPAQAQDRIILVSPPAAPAPPAPHHSPPAPSAPAAQPAPAPQPAYPYYPPPSADPMAKLVEQIGEQQKAMMSAVEKMLTQAKRPPGFIELPAGYPIAPGYIAVPDGMIPDPRGVGQAPAAAPATVVAQAPPAQVAPAAAAPVPAPAPSTMQAGGITFAQPAAPPPPEQQLASTIKMLSSSLRGISDLQRMLSSFSPQGRGGYEEPEAAPTPVVPPEPENPIQTQDVGGITMAYDRRTGKTNWAATLMGAAPKLAETAKTIVGEVGKLQRQQHEMTMRTVAGRTELARAITAAQQGVGQVPAPAALPPQPRPQPAPPPPQHVAPPPPQPPAPPRKTAFPVA